MIDKLLLLLGNYCGKSTLYKLALLYSIEYDEFRVKLQ